MALSIVRFTAQGYKNDKSCRVEFTFIKDVFAKMRIKDYLIMVISVKSGCINAVQPSLDREILQHTFGVTPRNKIQGHDGH